MGRRGIQAEGAPAAHRDVAGVLQPLIGASIEREEPLLISNRTDCCTERLAGAIVELLNDGGTVVATRTLARTSIPSSQDVSFGGTYASSVRVRLEGSGILSLAEVEVWMAVPTATEPVEDGICWKETYGRGVGTPLSECGAGTEKNGLLCYPTCQAGYKGVGPVCWETCPAGYTDDGALCRRNAHITSANNSSCPGYDVCGLTFAKGCSTCPPGYTNDGCTCRKDVHIFAKKSYGRGAGSPMKCAAGKQEDAGLCYSACSSDYKGVGPVCWGNQRVTAHDAHDRVYPWRMDEIATALSMGEVSWALRVAAASVGAARKSSARKQLAALRQLATIHLDWADDSDLPSAAKAATAWRKVTEAKGATADDFEQLAWAELLAFKPKKAKAALDETLARSKRQDRSVVEAAVAWAASRKNARRLDALIEAASSTSDVTRLTLAVRLLVQADLCPLPLADQVALPSEPVWDPATMRRVTLRVHAYRGANEKERAAAILKEWVTACERAVPKADDIRRHVLDASGSEDPVARAQRRVRRVTAAFGTDHPALENALASLAWEARHAEVHDVAVEALRKLDPFMQAHGGSQDALLNRHLVLGDLRKSLIALRRFTEAAEVLAREESVKAKRQLHLVPDHHARGALYEAQGDWEHALAEYVAAARQYEAGPPPVYGPTASNTELARGWARQAFARAGRKAEGEKLFPEKRSARK